MTSTFSTIFRGNYSKVFDFFLDNPRYDFTTTEIARNSDTNRITTVKIIKYFNKINVIKKSRKFGNGQLYVLNTENSAVRAIMKTELEITKLEMVNQSKIPVQMKTK